MGIEEEDEEDEDDDEEDEERAGCEMSEKLLMSSRIQLMA